MAEEAGTGAIGHECENVVLYRQEVFIPHLRELEPCLVKYTIGDVDRELELNLPNDVLKLVLVAHDEMTAQAHDGERMSWVWQGEQPLKKKGAGRGIHQPDFIRSTVGWLNDASKTLDYGKNHDGFWNGELFVKQVCFLSFFLHFSFLTESMKAKGGFCSCFSESTWTRIPSISNG